MNINQYATNHQNMKKKKIKQKDFGDEDETF
jgi:hypothetical protein